MVRLRLLPSIVQSGNSSRAFSSWMMIFWISVHGRNWKTLLSEQGYVFLHAPFRLVYTILHRMPDTRKSFQLRGVKTKVIRFPGLASMTSE